MGLRAAPCGARRRHRTHPYVLRRQHLLSLSVDARLLRAPVRAGRTDLSGLPGHQEPDPLLQTALRLDLRAVGSRNVLARARADRSSSRGVPRRTPLRIHSLPPRSGGASAGALGAVDAVGALRFPPLFRFGAAAAALGRHTGTHYAEPLMYLFPAVL